MRAGGWRLSLLAEQRELPEGTGRDRIRAELVELHTGYLRMLARQHRGRGEPMEEIEQAAMVGLVKAMNGFDPTVGERFKP